MDWVDIFSKFFSDKLYITPKNVDEIIEIIIEAQSLNNSKYHPLSEDEVIRDCIKEDLMKFYEKKVSCEKVLRTVENYDLWDSDYESEDHGQLYFISKVINLK